MVIDPITPAPVPANDNGDAPTRFCAGCGVLFALSPKQVRRNTMTCGSTPCRLAYAQHRRRVEYLERLERKAGTSSKSYHATQRG